MTEKLLDSLVSTSWLADQLGAEDLVLLDCTVFLEPVEGGFRAVSGESQFGDRHLPGARFADLTGDLCDRGSRWRFAVPTPEQFAAAMGGLGVSDASRVVLYDNNRMMWAARVWWMLRWIGFDNAALLDGGQKAWEAEGRPMSDEAGVPPAQGSLTPSPRPSLIADRDEVLAAIDDGAVCLIDALGEAQYRGEQNGYGRPGHIPGASNSPAMNLLDDDGRFRSDHQLSGMFGGNRSARTITYCGGGIAASADAFVMTRLGFTDVAVYTASLQEWAADEANPLTM
ncbi:MAG: sulfurtransferase [Actinomycetota bacterium]|nr:sulfurtransferase [Actinomycetota bacterium]